jgi:Putative adhesin
MCESFQKPNTKRIATPSVTRVNIRLVGLALLMATTLVWGQGKSTSRFQRTLTVTNAEPVVLNIEVSNGDVEVLYGRDGQVSITGFAQADGDPRLDDNYFPASLSLEQAGNRITIRHNSDPGDAYKLRCRIDVPYRTEVVSRVTRGKQTVSGIMGPAMVTAGIGDIKASYVSKGLRAEVETGNVDLQVIGEHIEARTGRGNISGERLPQGVNARTGGGDIKLMVIGPSTASVEKGNGRIEVGGAREALICSTDSGDMHVQAVPHSDWKLSSVSGAIRLDLPPVANFGLDVSTGSGEIQFERDDLSKLSSDLHQISQRVGGGGKRIEVHTGSGRIVIR